MPRYACWSDGAAGGEAPAPGVDTPGVGRGGGGLSPGASPSGMTPGEAFSPSPSPSCAPSPGPFGSSLGTTGAGGGIGTRGSEGGGGRRHIYFYAWSVSEGVLYFLTLAGRPARVDTDAFPALAQMSAPATPPTKSTAGHLSRVLFQVHGPSSQGLDKGSLTSSALQKVYWTFSLPHQYVVSRERS